MGIGSVGTNCLFILLMSASNAPLFLQWKEAGPSVLEPYAGASQFNHEPKRMRKLLLHDREIERLTGKTKERGLTLVALKLYFKGGRAKVEIGLGRGKKLYDKRETLKRKMAEREVERAIKAR